ncbi:MAG TPA: MFS transporter, partial [Gaiellaceae bacterium]|nr:MFS transporter [Gaiellaceae bacterium]
SIALFGFTLGNIVTKLGPRRTMLLADGVRAPLTAVIPILHWADALSFPLLLMLVAAISALITPSFSSKAALLPDLVGDDETRLTEANALLQGAGRITLLLGPPLGGALIAVIGATSVLLIDAVSFVVAFMLVATLVRGRWEPEPHEDRGLAAGIRFILRDRLLRTWGTVVVISDALWLGLFAALPVLVIERYGEQPEIVGLAWGAWGGGAVLGSVVAFRFVASFDRLLVSSFGELGMIIPLWLLLVDGPPLMLAGLMLASGLANGLVNAPIHTIVQLRTPRALRQKVWGAIIAGSAVIGPVVLLIAGPSLERVGLEETLLAIVLVQTVCAIVFAIAGMRERARVGAIVPEAA